MDSKKIFIKNFWLKNYKLKNVFFKDKDKKYIKSYLSRQNYIKYDLIKKNFLILYNKKYPLAYVLTNKGRAVGFLGTLFSKRLIKNKNYLFCNIHSWLVDSNHRVAAQLLFKKILDKCIITVFTARPGLTKTFRKMGFKSLQMRYRIVFLINNYFFSTNKKKILIDRNKSNLLKKINSYNLKIHKDHSNEKFLKFLIYNQNNDTENSFIVAKIVKKKKYIKVLNLLYVDNENFIRNNWNSIQPTIFKEFNIFFCGQFFLNPQRSVIPKISFFSKDVKKEIFIKNLKKNYKFNTLYSEFDF